MAKLTRLQEKVEKFIEANRIHLHSYALFDKEKFKNKNALLDEIKHARIILSNSIVNHLMSKDKVKEYLKEIPPDKDIKETTLKFDAFVFSESQLRDFVEMIQNYKKPVSNIIPFSRVIH